MAKKILIVDDEPNIVQVIAERLSASGYKVVVGYDSVQAVNLAHSEKPDLILLDIKMPAGGGIGVFESLKRSVHTSIIPVIFITAYGDEETRKKVIDKGAADFITKPFESNDLIMRVKKALGELK